MIKAQEHIIEFAKTLSDSPLKTNDDVSGLTQEKLLVDIRMEKDFDYHICKH